MEEPWYQQIAEKIKQFGEWVYKNTHCPECQEYTLTMTYCSLNENLVCKKCILVAQQKDNERRRKEEDDRAKVQCATCKVGYLSQKLTISNDRLYYCDWCRPIKKRCYFCKEDLGQISYNNTEHVTRRNIRLPSCHDCYLMNPSW